MMAPFLIVGALNFAKVLRFLVDRLRDRPRITVISRALDAPARERGKHAQR